MLPVRFNFEYAIAVAFQTPVAIVPTDVSDDAVTFDARVVPVRVPAAAVTIISSEPLKAIPLIFLGVCSVVAVDALPVRAPTKDVDVIDERPTIVVSVPPSDTEELPIVIELLSNLAFWIEPLSIVFVTVPESPVVTTLPLVAGKTIFTVVAIVSAGLIVREPLVLPESVIPPLIDGDEIEGLDAKTRLPVPVVPEIRPRNSDADVVCANWVIFPALFTLSVKSL
jgi:hypothetical protein